MNANTETQTPDVAADAQLPVVNAPSIEPRLVEVKTVGYVQTAEQAGTNDQVVA